MENIERSLKAVPTLPVKKRNTSKKYLINKLNYLNFLGKSALVNLKHKKYERIVTLDVHPQPCTGEHLDCFWVQPENLPPLELYSFDSILIPDGTRLLKIHSTAASLSPQGICVCLPESCVEIGSRNTVRHSCQKLSAKLTQNSLVFDGLLIDFNSSSFRIETNFFDSQNLSRIVNGRSVELTVYDGNNICYSSKCRILRQEDGKGSRDFVLEPLVENFPRFNAKNFRSIRHQLKPAPTMNYIHPFLNKKFFGFKILDISGMGFSVREEADSALLQPGMIIRAGEINFASSMTLSCSLQVVHRTMYTEESISYYKYGIAILDMSPGEHACLLSILNQASDDCLYMCNKIDPEILWDLFFETGFIYPEKYKSIEKNKLILISIYKKLYQESPNIARHFTIQENGTLGGHMAMLRFYNRSWLVHHHAASHRISKKAGISILNQATRFLNDSHNLRSIRLEYVLCYFRPENKFPRRVFGGFYDKAKSKIACTLEKFAYFHYTPDQFVTPQGDDTWNLQEASHADMEELRTFYDFKSGGTLPKALDLEESSKESSEVVNEFERSGFIRKKYIFSLKIMDSLKAVMLINISDIGLNLSDLNNSIHVFVIDEDGTTKNILFSCFSDISKRFGNLSGGFPVLIYPHDFTGPANISTEKNYSLWILNLSNLDDFFHHCQSLFGEFD